MNWKKIELYNVITKLSARRALPDNDQMYSVNENTQITKQTELKAPDSGPTPAFGHACPLGGRCFCIRYPVGRGRGPARF